MNKKNFKGGIRLLQTEIVIKKDNKILDGIIEREYKKGSIKTEDKQDFILYKITGITKYDSEQFILPDINTTGNIDDINKDTLKDIYLFGYSNNNNTLFVKKNTSSNSISIQNQLNHIGTNLNKLLSNKNSDEELNINIILIYNKKNNFLIIIFDMNMKTKHYKKFEALFFPAFFVSDEKLKEKINKSYLKILINYTYKKISHLRNQEINFDYIKTQFNDKHLKEQVLVSDDENEKKERKDIQSDIEKIKKKIDKIEKNGDEDNIDNLKDLIDGLKNKFINYVNRVNGLTDNQRDTLKAFNNWINGGYKKNIKRKELYTLSLAELKQLHRSNGIKMNNNRNKIGLIKNYIKNNVNN